MLILNGYWKKKILNIFLFSGSGLTIEAERILWKLQASILFLFYKVSYPFSGDFVKAHGLQAGDYNIIYRSSTSENYVSFKEYEYTYSDA